MTDLYHIIKVPDPVLKEKARPVDTIDETVKGQIKRMFETMYDAPGIGLAANQVGLLNRVFVMDLAPESWIYDGEKNGVLQIKSAYRSGEDDEDPKPKEPHPIAMINPEIVWRSEQRSVFEEGCLSMPGQYGVVERPAQIKVKYLDPEGQTHEIEAEGLHAHCIQHEIDHLDGVLFIDYLSSLKRNMIIRRMEKMERQRGL